MSAGTHAAGSVRRGRPLVAMAVIVVTLGLVGAADVLVGDPNARAVPVATSDAAGETAVSGAAVCAVGDGRPGTSTTVDIVRPVRADEAPATATTEVFAGGSREMVDTARLFPGAAAHLEIVGEADVATEVTWTTAPVTTARSWRLEGTEDLPPGTAAGPCSPTTAATTWTVPGLITSGGHDARLRVSNPHQAAATIGVRFLTPDGPEDPTRLRNISVPPNGTIELELNEFVPERDDLAAIVEVASGRVAVEGVQLTRSAIGDVDGVSLLQASTGPSEVATVPWVVDGEGRRSWLWVANATDRTAPVELTVHGADGGVVAAGLAEVEVPPGTVRRVDLRGTLGEGVDSAAVTARSDGTPVTVSGVTELRADDVAETGFAVQLAVPAADPVWTVAGGSTADRREQLRLVNPGSEPATVDVTLWNGTTTSTPDALSGVEVPAGALVSLPLAGVLGDVSSWAATVRAASGEVVVGRVGLGDPSDALHLVAAAGAPSAWWRVPGDAPPVRPAPGTTQRLGTELGIEPVDPLAPDADADDVGGEDEAGVEDDAGTADDADR